jgi:hypothetical protein
MKPNSPEAPKPKKEKAYITAGPEFGISHYAGRT